MLNINRVELLGNLVEKPEIRYTAADQTMVANIRLATNRSYKPKGSDEWKEVSAFHSLSLFGRDAEKVSMMDKGERLHIIGELYNDSWESQSGEKHHTMRVRPFSVKLVDKRRNSDEQPTRDPSPRSQPQSPPADEFPDDDIPF